MPREDLHFITVRSIKACVSPILDAMIKTPISDDAGEHADAAIVPQDDGPPKGLTPRRLRLPAPVRVSFFSALALIAWLSWPHNSPVVAPPAAPGLSVSQLASAQVLTPTATAPPAAPDVAIDGTDRAGRLADEGPPAAADTLVLPDPLPTKVAVVRAPTATPTALPTEPPPPPDSSLPQVRIIPAVGIKLPPTRTPAAEAIPQGPPPTPTPVPLPIEPGRLWSSFTPPPPDQNDHFWVGRPFLPSAPNQLASPSYQFGSTAGNRYRPHHGVDISNPMGTPVLAATEGEVVHAGPDDGELLGPYNNFYGNTVVIRLDRRLAVGDGELDVYVLYGHLSQVFAAVGQRVGPEDVVGAVGMTGIAIGPHLHVEIRVGANTYRHSVNPYLWMQPIGDTGAVAVRLLTADGRTWPGARLTLARFQGGVATWARQIETYLEGESILPNPAWGENGAMDGAPPGAYVIVGSVNGESIRADLTVNPGQTTFVEIRTRQ